jgi:hypothetical protein
MKYVRSRGLAQEGIQHEDDYHERRNSDLLQRLGTGPVVTFSHGWPPNAEDIVFRSQLGREAMPSLLNDEVRLIFRQFHSARSHFSYDL